MAAVALRELVLGGQKSGKSRRGEMLAAAWLAADPAHRALLIATARAGDEEMRARIARHRADRAARLPALASVEVPVALPEAIRDASAPGTMVVVDCLTLWLTNLRMPVGGVADGVGADVLSAGRTGFAEFDGLDDDAPAARLVEAIGAAPGPLVLIGNEIGLGVIPLGGATRAFVDALGRLNQQVARACDRVTLMVAGLPLCVKGAA